MKKLCLVLVSLLVLSGFSAAQQKVLDLDAIFGPDPAKRVRFSGSLPQIRWSADGRYLEDFSSGKMQRLDPATGRAVWQFDSAKLSLALARIGIRGDEADRIASSPMLQFSSDGKGIVLDQQNDLWYYAVAEGTLKRLTNDRAAEAEEAFSPDGRFVSFIRGNNLFIVDVAKADTKQITRDGKEGDKPIYNGYLDWVYEEELYGRGNKRGYWWSPDSKKIAFLRLDEAKVPTFTIPNDIPNGQLIEVEHYPKAGDPNPDVRLGIADITKNTIVPNAGRIPKIGEKLPPTLLRFGDAVKFVDLSGYKRDDLLIARVSWAADGNSVLFEALDREQTNMDLNAATLDGKVQKLINETTPAWVEVYDDPIVLKDSSRFIWQSARNGWRHLYLYENDGRLVRQLTNGKWEIRNVYGVDEKNGYVYFAATKDSHIAENIYRVSLEGGEPQRLTSGDGTHAAMFNAGFSAFIDVASDAMTPPQMYLNSADGTRVRTLAENRVDVLRQYGLSNVEFLKVPTRDGFKMEAMMIKPPDFDASKKYPVFEYTYSGPHAPSVANRWQGTRMMWFQMLAQKGYIIWVCDNRSASGKGEESVWPMYKRMYELELRDLEDGVSYLRSLAYVDGDRIGLHGWSYGGSMTSYAMTHSRSWKVGIAGGTVADEHLYDSIYTERYMLTPQNNPEGYERSSVVKAAANLNGKLLLIHGMMDDNVHLQNTTQLAYALQKAGKQFDLMLYPTQRHGVADPQQARHLYELMTDYIIKNL
ncbi:MAG: DPP IV N-terminal domain-containing protein [Acidobacteria bacterium]|nr:DPP IV N-terminal domain-containing protein [Acidobacteriota bacterium]